MTDSGHAAAPREEAAAAIMGTAAYSSPRPASSCRPWRRRVLLFLPVLFLGLSLGLAPLPVVAASFLERAQQYFEEGDLRSAAVELKNVLQGEPGNAAARFLLGRVHLQSGDIAAAEKELLRARDLGYRGEDFDLTLSYLRLRQGRFQDVVTGISEEIAIESSLQRDLYAARGEALLGLGRFDEASAIFDRILADGPQTYALLGKARVAMALGDPETARGYLDRAAEWEPDSPDQVLLNAAWLFQKRRFDEAKTRFARAIELDPSRLAAYLGLIQSQLELGELEAAEGLIRSLAAAQPDNLLIVLQDSIVQFLRGEYHAAKTAADRVLAADDSQPQALSVAGYSAYRLEEYEQARAHLSAYLAFNPADARARMVLGATLLRLGFSEEAYEVVGSSEIEVPDSADYLGVLTNAAFGAGDREAGLRYLEQLAAKSPDNYDIQERLGTARMALGDPAGAIAAFTRARDIDPARIEANARLFVVHLQQQDTETALALARGVVDKFPDQALGDTLLGIAYLAASDRAQARAAFGRALEKEPGNSGAANNLANILRIEGETEKAREVLQGLLEANPGDLRALLTAAEMETQAGDLAAAAALLQQAVESHPKEVQARVLLANYHIRESRYAEALALVEPALRDNPTQIGLLESVGQARLKSGDRAGALEAFATLARLAPERPEAQEYLMFALERNGRVAEALAAAERTLELAPENQRARFGRVRYLAQIGRLEEARAALEPLKAALPDQIEVLQVEGRIALVERRTEDGIAVFRRAFDLRRDNLMLIELTRALFAGGRRDEGLSMMRSWLEEFPEDLLIHNTVAETYIGLSRYPEAQAQYEKILAIAPDSARALNNLAWVRTELGDAAAAVPLARKARELAPRSPDVADTLAMALLQGGEKEEALELLDQARRDAGGNVTIRFHFALALVENGRDAQAIAVLETLLQDAETFREREEAEKLLAKLNQ